MNIREYYNGYAEPISIIDVHIKNQINIYLLSIDYNEFEQLKFEEIVLNHLKSIKKKGFEFEEFKLTTFSNCKTYRIIKDNLYSSPRSYLDDETY